MHTPRLLGSYSLFAPFFPQHSYSCEGCGGGAGYQGGTTYPME